MEYWVSHHSNTPLLHHSQNKTPSPFFTKGRHCCEIAGGRRVLTATGQQDAAACREHQTSRSLTSYAVFPAAIHLRPTSLQFVAPNYRHLPIPSQGNPAFP